jgi:hypothetical protein
MKVLRGNHLKLTDDIYQRKNLACIDCHDLSKAVCHGLRTPRVTHGPVKSIARHRGEPTEAANTPGLDTFVALNDTALQHGSLENLRPFNGDELRRILWVGLCAGCHDCYTDSVWKTYTEKSFCPDPRGTSEFTDARWPTPAPVTSR